MTTEHDLAHGRGAPRAPSPADDDLMPGRGSRSSQLAAPSHPIAGGLLLRKARDANGVAEDADAAVASAAGSPSSPLPVSIQRRFESSLGTDLSAVRVHTGPESQASAAAVGARAYTVGQDIHFAAGQYDPHSASGQHLIAHEVAHTVQQADGSAVRQNKLEVSSPMDAAEHEADRAADAMIVGAPAVIASAPATAARKLHREANKQEDSPHGNDKFFIETGELKILPKDGLEISYVRVDAAAKLKGSAEFIDDDGHGQPEKNDEAGGVAVVPNKSKGIKVESKIAEQDLLSEFELGMFESEKAKEKWSFEVSTEKANISIGAELQFRHQKYHWLKATGECSFTFVDLKWKDLAEGKAKIVSATPFAGSIGGEGTVFCKTINRHVKFKGVGELKITASPNWKKIAAKCAEELAKKAGQGAADGAAAVSTGTAAGAGAAASADGVAMVSTATVASEVALATLPFAAAALMVYGGMQTEKNIKASRAASEMGIKMRNEIKSYVHSYITTLSGGTGSGKGHLDADAKVFAYMAATNKERADACKDIMDKNGGKEKLTAELLGRARDEAYKKGVAMFEERWAGEFGLIEKIGDTWGMRGVFRSDFRRLLYADE